jgi:hypothetical protein
VKRTREGGGTEGERRGEERGGEEAGQKRRGEGARKGGKKQALLPCWGMQVLSLLLSPWRRLSQPRRAEEEAAKGTSPGPAGEQEECLLAAAASWLPVPARRPSRRRGRGACARARGYKRRRAPRTTTTPRSWFG